MEIRDLEVIEEISDEEAAKLDGGYWVPAAVAPATDPVSRAIQSFKDAQRLAALHSINAATEITRINSVPSVIKKIGPG